MDNNNNPVPMVLKCPCCGGQHIDEGAWATRPHKRHKCTIPFCYFEWAPYDYETVGVRELPAAPPQGVGQALTDGEIRFRFFKHMDEGQRLSVFKAFGVYPDNCNESLNNGIERRLLDAILKRKPEAQAAPAIPELTDEQILDIAWKHMDLHKAGRFEVRDFARDLLSQAALAPEIDLRAIVAKVDVETYGEEALLANWKAAGGEVCPLSGDGIIHRSQLLQMLHAAARRDQERAAMQDMLDDAHIERDAIREALGVLYEPHQSLRDRMLEAARKARPASESREELRDLIGQAINDEIQRGAPQPDWCDSREIDRLAEAALKAIEKN